MSASIDEPAVASEGALAGALAAEGPPSPLALLFSPDRAMERQARIGRARWLVLFACVCSLLLGAALALRVDAAASTLQKLDASGRLTGMSERQLADETRNAERVFEVVSVARGALGAPVGLGLACAAMVGLAWFLRGRLEGRAVVPVAAATLLPGAVADLADALSAFRRAALPIEGFELAPRSLGALLSLLGRPLVDPWSKLGGALDFFSLWGAFLMAFGVAAAARVPRRSALAGTLIAWVCYRLLTHVAVGG